MRDDDFAQEGGVIYRLHRSRERNRALIDKKKAAVLAALGKLACEVCDFVFGDCYGDIGSDFIEVHHKKLVATLVSGDKTRMTDLALVCANCHRMLHRQYMRYNIAALRARILAGGTTAMLPSRL